MTIPRPEALGEQHDEPSLLERVRNVALIGGGLCLAAVIEVPSAVLTKVGLSGLAIGALTHVTDKVYPHE